MTPDDVAAAEAAGLLACPCTPGDLLDRLVILELKLARRPGDRAVATMLDHLRPCSMALDTSGRGVVAALAGLRVVNESLWEAEDRVRSLLAQGAPEDVMLLRDFAAVAAAVPRLNDRRCVLKQRLDALLRPGAPSEPKVYCA